MERITPQYKRGKYIRRRKRRRRRRILIVCLILAVVLAAAVLLFVFRDRIFHSEEPVPTDASGVPVSTEAPVADTSESEDSDGTLMLAEGKLLLTFDSDVLSLIQNGDLTTLLNRASDADTPRMDIEKLPSKLGMLRDSELERIAIGLMQAYYFHPQHTEDVALTVLRNDKSEFSAVMEVPAIDDAPAAVCTVRLLAVGDELWAAVLLVPEGTESPALTTAFEQLTTTGENGN